MSMLDLLLLSAAIVYAVGVVWYRRRYAKSWGAWRCAAFFAALVTIAFALEGMDEVADRWFSAHMFQHLLLVDTAAPFVLFGEPFVLAATTLPLPVVRPIMRVLHAPLVRWIAAPLVCWIVWPVVFWVAHFSPLYELALEDPLVHFGEHALFFAAALLFWMPVIGGSPMSGHLRGAIRALYLFTAMPQSALLGMALSGAGRVLYGHYRDQVGVSAALEDQQVGADIMWIAGGAVSALAFLLAVMSWAREERRSMKRATNRAAYSAFVCAVLLLTAPALAGAPSAPERAHGARLYAEHCASCHGEALQGSPQAPPLMGAGAASVDFYVSTGRMPVAAPGIEPMRDFSTFSSSETAAIVEYVTSRSGGSRELPNVRPSGDIVRGRRFFEANCQACHGAVGQGASVGYGWTAPSLKWSTSRQIAEAVRVGPGVMPIFNRRTLSDEDLAALVAYVHDLQARTDDRGGWSLGHLGPVGEGLVGWIVGFGSLLGLIRWIGTTVREET